MAVSRPVHYTGTLSRSVANLLAKHHLGPSAEVVSVEVIESHPGGSAVVKKWLLRSPVATTADGHKWWVPGEGGTPAFAFINARIFIMSNNPILLEWLRFLKARRESGQNAPEREFCASLGKALAIA